MVAKSPYIYRSKVAVFSNAFSIALRTALAKVSPNWEKVPVSVRSSPFGSMVMMTPSVDVPVAG